MLLQQTAVVPILRFFHHPRHPGSPVTLHIWTHHEDRDFRPRMCHRPSFSYFLIFEQNQRKMYREVLIAGDLSPEDLYRAIDIGGTDWVSYA